MAVVPRFDDRLDPETYRDDPLVGVYHRDPGEADALWVPERLFWRLRHVAEGYNLHLLPLLGGFEPVELTRPMVQTLLDELEFVLERLNDPVADQWGGELIQRADAALRGTGDPLLTIEGE